MNHQTLKKKMGLFILDDMIEYLGQNLLEKIWVDILNILLPYTDSNATELRQASTYGLGEFAKHTVKDFNLYVNFLLTGIQKALDKNDDGEDSEEFGHAKDNAISALGKIIKYQNQYLDINTIVPQWLGYLPLKWDPKEAVDQHELLVEIIEKNPSIVIGNENSNLPRLLRILAYVIDTKYSSEELDGRIKKNI